jgi:hypothetical protein
VSLTKLIVVDLETKDMNEASTGEMPHPQGAAAGAVAGREGGGKSLTGRWVRAVMQEAATACVGKSDRNTVTLNM